MPPRKRVSWIPFTALIPAHNLAQHIAVGNWEGLLQFPRNWAGFLAVQRQRTSSSGVVAQNPVTRVEPRSAYPPDLRLLQFAGVVCCLNVVLVQFGRLYFAVWDPVRIPPATAQRRGSGPVCNGSVATLPMRRRGTMLVPFIGQSALHRAL